MPPELPVVSFSLPGGPYPVRRGHLQFGGERPGARVGVNSYYLEWNGKPWLPIMGEFQYSRYPAEEWETELLKVKAGGVQVVATYVFWIHHEEEEGRFDWSGWRDLGAFLGLCRKHGLLVALRIGPFNHGEVRNGGLPDWLYGRSFEIRCDDPSYLALVGRFYGEIGKQASGSLFREGGPIVFIQIENEFMDSAAPWETTQLPGQEYTPKGSGGIGHLRSLRSLAQEAGLDAPFFTATAWGKAPAQEDEFLPLYGGYAFHPWADGVQAPTDCYVFQDFHARPMRQIIKYDPSRVPFASCEMGGGMQGFYRKRPVVPAASVEAMQVVYLGRGTNLVGYYVYHGGSNPVGRRSFLNEHRCPRISYDFQAPIREFGQLHGSYHRLRRQFLFLQEWGSLLAPLAPRLPDGPPMLDPRNTEAIRAIVRADSRRGFVFLNNFQDHVEMPPKGPFRLATGEVTWPLKGSLKLESDAAVILPFHLDLDGVDLVYATAQPLARIEGEGEIRYFFFTSPGGSAELAFSRMVHVHLDGGGEIEEEGQFKIVRLECGLRNAVTIKREAQRPVRITVVDDAESLRFWKAELWGRERVVVSDADLLFRDGGLEIIGQGGETASLAIYPPPDGALAGPLDEDEGETEGPFRRYVLALPSAPARCSVRRLDPARVVVELDADSLEGLDELLLKVECDGDVATAHHDGRLIHDHFCNGLRWELGLRRFVPAGRPAEIVLRVSPKRGDGAEAKLVTTAMASMEVVDSEGAVATIGSVEAVARRRFPVRMMVRQPAESLASVADVLA